VGSVFVEVVADPPWAPVICPLLKRSFSETDSTPEITLYLTHPQQWKENRSTANEDPGEGLSVIERVPEARGIVGIYAGSSTQRVWYMPTPTAKRRVARVLPALVQKALTYAQVTLRELESLDFLYKVVLPMAHVALLGHGEAFLHAGSFVRRNGQGAVVTFGAGGVGKTSLTTHLLLGHPDEWAFLADDLSLVTANGWLRSNCMDLHVYRYHLAAVPELGPAIRRLLSPTDRVLWGPRVAESADGRGQRLGCRPVSSTRTWQTTVGWSWFSGWRELRKVGCGSRELIQMSLPGVQPRLPWQSSVRRWTSWGQGCRDGWG